MVLDAPFLLSLPGLGSAAPAGGPWRSSPCPGPPPLSQNPQVPGCSLWFNGTFTDNISLGRRGVTSLNWPKPKIKVDSKQGSVRGDPEGCG